LEIGERVKNLKWRGDFTISKAYIFNFQDRWWSGMNLREIWPEVVDSIGMAQNRV
jgi:hypothetical protein